MINFLKNIRFVTLLLLFLFFTENAKAIGFLRNFEFFIEPEITNYFTENEILYGFHSDSDFDFENPYLIGSRFGVVLPNRLFMFDKTSIFTGLYYNSSEHEGEDRFGDSISKKMNQTFFDLGVTNSLEINDKLDWHLSVGLFFGSYTFKFEDLYFSDYNYNVKHNGLGTTFGTGFSRPITESSHFYAGLRYKIFNPKASEISYPKDSYGLIIEEQDMSSLDYIFSLRFSFGND